MTVTITASVGASGRNLRPDVTIVQRLLADRGVSPGRIDGQCGPHTVNAILRFQAQFLAHPDGRVDPQGATLRRLTAPHTGGTAHAPQTPHNPTARPGIRPPAAPATHAPQPPAAHAPLDAALTALVPRPSRDTINQGLTAVSPAFMVQELGNPRESYNADCQPMTNATLRRFVVSDSVGPFRVTGLRPAVESLRAAFTQISQDQPAVYAALGTAGMLCCRLVRGSATAISNHSWGTAIDLKLNGVLDRRGDSQVQTGLTLIASIMNTHGWYWGAAFRTEDAMHFEASRALISRWAPLVR